MTLEDDDSTQKVNLTIGFQLKVLLKSKLLQCFLPSKAHQKLI